MFISLMLLVASSTQATLPTPRCRAAQLQVSLDAGDGEYSGMQQSGTALSIRNTGADCMLPASPNIVMRDARGRAVAACRGYPADLPAVPAHTTFQLGGGHRAMTIMRWVSGPAYPHGRSVRVVSMTIRIGTATLQVPLRAVVYGEAGKPITFSATSLRVVEGMPAG